VRQLLGERYDVDTEIGRGGAARVFRATDRLSHAPVALKVLRPELLVSHTAQRFLREIDVLRQLDHPHIAPILDSGEVLDAVAHAHARGIVHRDVKPENIVLNPAQGAVLLDFGIARAILMSEGERVTRSGFTVGTSHYMSPEQAAGQPIDHRADLYALGCVLFECLAGQPPFKHDMESHVLMLHQRAPVPDVRKFRPEVPKPLARALERAMAKDPAERWQTAGEFKAALEAVTL